MPRRLASTDSLRRFGPGLTVLASAAVFGFSGCGGSDRTEVASGEIRLTTNAEWNTRPTFSPDGEEIAFSCRRANGNYTVCVLPARGGTPVDVTADSLSYVALCWDPSGDALFAIDFHREVLTRLDLFGRVLETYPDVPLARVLDIAPDGRTFLFAKFNGDNYDPGFFDAATGEFELIQETPVFEVNGCFGPGPDEITLVVAETATSEITRMTILDLAQGQYRDLPLGEARLASPSWSPDRRYLLYSSNRDKSQDIWIYDARTRETFPITSGPEEDVAPAWAPDGQAVTFARRIARANVYVMDVATGNEVRITDGPGRDSSPILSPDGSRVAFVHHPSTAEAKQGLTADILVGPSDGSAPPRPLGIRGLRSKTERSFCWSPDGSEIAYAASDGNDDTEIFRIPVDGGEAVPVTISSGVEVLPAWSPDGKSIAYMRLEGGETNIWMVPATGGLAVQLSRHGGIHQIPVWSPDSRFVAYHSILEEGGVEVWITPVDAPQEERRIFRSRKRDEWTVPFAFSEDGRTLLAYRVSRGVWSVWTVPLDGSPGFLVGTPRGRQGRLQYQLEFTAEGRRFLHDVYPGGRIAMTDGEKISEIYVLSVKDRLAPELAAR